LAAAYAALKPEGLMLAPLLGVDDAAALRVVYATRP
jgi:hypothetical protein